MRTVVRAAVGFLLAAGLLLPAVPAVAAPAPASGAAAGQVTSVVATTSRIVVSGHLASGADLAGTSLALYDLDPLPDDSAYSSLTPVARQAASAHGGTSFRISAPRFRATAPASASAPVPAHVHDQDGYFNKYLVVLKGPAGSQPLGTAEYPVADFPARYSYPYPRGWDKKGISAVQMTDDAETLGASSSAVNVAVNQIMPAPTGTWRRGPPRSLPAPAGCR
jgi:hypothetical protein